MGMPADQAPPDDPTPEEQANPLLTYWAADTPDKCLAMLEQKRDEYFQTALARGFVNMWRIAAANIFGQDPYTPGQFDTQTIGVEDADGGQLRFRVNEPASFLRQQVVMATGQRAAFQAVAENTDSSAMAMAQVVDSAVDYVYKREMTDQREATFVRTEGGYGAAYVWWRWDRFSGESVTVGVTQIPLPPDKQPPEVQQGLAPPQTAPKDILGPSGKAVAVVLRPWEEFHEVMRRGRDHLWRCVLERRSRWELMALYPSIADKLAEVDSDPNIVERQLFGQYYYLTSADDVVVQHFYHVAIGDPNDESNPLRNGRYIASVGGIMLPGCDTALPIDDREIGLPIFEGMSLPMEDIAFGVASWWDLIACQQGQDQVVSDMLSNINTFGRTSGFYPEGAEIDLDALAAGGGWFQVPANAGAPSLLNPPAMPQIAPWVSDYCDKKKQSLSGLNAVTRGDPGANISSGEMAALFTNLSVEFNSDKQMMVDAMRRASANIVANLILNNAENDLLVQIAGLDERPYITKFKPEMLRGVRIEMQSAPPMMRNAAGRMQIFQMLEKVPPEERAAAIMLITTGQWRQMTDTDSAEWILIKWENEQLAQGMQFPEIPPPPPQPPPVPGQPIPQPPPSPNDQKAAMMKKQFGVGVSATDDPEQHLPQHALLYNQLAIDPVTNANAIAAVTVHILDHVHQQYSKDPMLAALLKQPPPPPQPTVAPTQPQQHAGGPPGAVPKGPDDKGSPLPNGGSAKPADRLGPQVPHPAQPPPGAAVPNAPPAPNGGPA
jgi:hypothetical protein